MSDSDFSDASRSRIPTDDELRNSLRREVRKAVEAGKEVTVRLIRQASAKSLNLPEGFYTNDDWKLISKEVIHAEYEIADNERQRASQSPNSVKASTKSTAPVTKRTTKQNPPATTPPKKKRKMNSSSDDSSVFSAKSSDIGNVIQEDEPKKSSKGTLGSSETEKASQQRRTTKSDEVDQESEDGATGDDNGAGSGSDMSVVLDDEPTKKRRSESKDGAEAKSRQSQAPKSKTTADDDPAKEEVKKLQGWLVKCGVRKVWGKELKPYETSKAKIKHLKEMLSDVGMAGRFSIEKASQIKEARELAADIEAVQEGAQRWGKDEDSADNGDNRTRGGRRIVRGAKNYEFLSSDGEETD